MTPIPIAGSGMLVGNWGQPRLPPHFPVFILDQSARPEDNVETEGGGVNFDSRLLP